MNLILLFKDDFIDNTHMARLDGRRLEHLRNVHRASAGDELTVGLAGGLIGKGRIISIKSDTVEMEVDLIKDPPRPLPVTLVLALPRPKVLRRVLITASSMGVKKIILVNTFRVEKSFWKSPLLSGEHLKDQLILGLEQASDTIMPEVLLKPLFKPFVEDELPQLIEGSTPLVAHPAAEGECPVNSAGHITLAVGPEGGFIPYEIEKFRECGFTAFHMGDRILRVEAALPALLSKIC